MLTIVQLEIVSLEDGLISAGNSLLNIHGLFLKLIKEADPFLSKMLHDRPGFKPFTLSMLKGGKNVKGEIVIKKEKNYKIRISFLEDSVFLAFFNAVYSRKRQLQPIKLGGINFQIERIRLEKNEDYNDLLNNKNLERHFQINFISPTSFRVNGRNYLFPDPNYLIRSYFDKWNAFCPSDLKINDEVLETFLNFCFPVKHKLNTELVDMGKYKIIGFKGNCLYQVDINTESEKNNKLKALLLFSEYCGTGYKTTMGMGQTNIIFCRKN